MKKLMIVAGWIWIAAAALSISGVTRATVAAAPADNPLDAELAAALAHAGFTGTIESQLETRLGRRVDPRLADLGRLLWFDKILALHHDNACAGCHSPAHGFGDAIGMAIGVQDNNL